MRLLIAFCLPRFAGGSASASLLSGPAQASLTLRPVGLLNRPRRPLSRGFDPAGCPTEPLVSYQSNRQFSGRNLPPLVIRAFGAHYKNVRLLNGYSIWLLAAAAPGEEWPNSRRALLKISLRGRRAGPRFTTSCGSSSVRAAIAFLPPCRRFVWWQWEDIVRRPEVKRFIKRLKRKPIPAALAGRLTIAVAHLDNDKDREHESLLLDELRHFESVEVVSVDRTVDPEQSDKKIAEEDARGLLRQTRADVLMGEHAPDRAGPCAGSEPGRRLESTNPGRGAVHPGYCPCLRRRAVRKERITGRERRALSQSFGRKSRARSAPMGGHAEQSRLAFLRLGARKGGTGRLEGGGRGLSRGAGGMDVRRVFRSIGRRRRTISALRSVVSGSGRAGRGSLRRRSRPIGRRSKREECEEGGPIRLDKPR